MRLKAVENVKLDEPLFLQDEFRNYSLIAASETAISGAEIVFLRERKNRALVFSSDEIAWQSKACIDALIALAESSADSELVLLTDTGQVRARFDYTDAAVSAEPLFKSAEPLFYLTLKLKKV